MKQCTHETSGFETKRFPLILILDGVTSPANLGSLFRLADAFNIGKIISCGTEVDLKSNRLRRTARSTVKNVIFEEREDVISVCDDVAKNGYKLFALEITKDSFSLDAVDFSRIAKVALIVGNESSGIKEEVLMKVHTSLHINMFGKNSSMNVAQATAIALFQITKTLQPY